MKKKIISTFFMGGIIISLLYVSCSREPKGGGIAQFLQPQEGRDLPEEWSNEKNIKWTYDLEGRGWSSPVVSGDLVFITTAVNETNPPKPEPDAPAPPPPPRPANEQRPAAQPGQPPRPQGAPPVPREDTTYKRETYRWEVICLDLKTGSEIWKRTARKGSPRTGTNPGNGYAAETPATDGERLYAYFGMNGLYCYDLQGNMLWEKDLGAYRTQNFWGTGSSPVLHEGTLYIQADNEESSFIVALDCITGEEKWRTPREEKTSYSTPFIWKNKVRTELVAGGLTIRSYDPSTGKLFWECSAGGRYSIPSASGDENLLYIGNAGGPDKPGNLFAVKAGASGDISLKDTAATSNEWIEWSLPDAGTGNPSPLLYNGLIYVLASRGGNLNCIEASSGRIIYTRKIENVGACWASPWVFNNRIFFTDEKGVTHSFTPGPVYELLPQNRINDRFWASPGIGGNSYIFKGVKKVYCVAKS